MGAASADSEAEILAITLVETGDEASGLEYVDKIIGLAGNVAAYAGVLLCVVSAVGRLLGYFFIAGVSAQALFMLGIGAMVFACLAKLHLLLQR